MGHPTQATLCGMPLAMRVLVLVAHPGIALIGLAMIALIALLALSGRSR